MTEATITVATGTRPASRARWWVTVALVFLTQLGLVFWFGRKEPLLPADKGAPGLTYQLITTRPGPLASLTDPTLFALPHQQSFSGPAWMTMPPPSFTGPRWAILNPPPVTSFTWSEPVRYLEVPFGPVGADVREPTLTNAFSAVEAIARTEVKPRFAEESRPQPISRPSAWRLGGDLARRRLLTPLDLGPQRSDDLLTNTVVQLVVDAQGRTVSVALLPPGSGSKDADQQALTLASAARFEPLSSEAAQQTAGSPFDLRWGELVFEWQTLPPLGTNQAPTAAQPGGH